MSWDGYAKFIVDGSNGASGASGAGIYGANGGAWGVSGVPVEAADVAKLIAVVEAGQYDSLRAAGPTVNGTKFMVTTAGDGVVQGMKGKASFMLKKSVQCYVFAYSNESSDINLRFTSTMVTNLADKLKAAGY